MSVATCFSLAPSVSRWKSNGQACAGHLICMHTLSYSIGIEAVCLSHLRINSKAEHVVQHKPTVPLPLTFPAINFSPSGPSVLPNTSSLFVLIYKPLVSRRYSDPVRPVCSPLSRVGIRSVPDLQRYAAPSSESMLPWWYQNQETASLATENHVPYPSSWQTLISNYLSGNPA